MLWILLRCPPQTSGEQWCLFNPHPAVFLLCHLGALAGALWLVWAESPWAAGAVLTCTLFLLNTPNPEVNTLLLSCCSHHTEPFTKGSKNRNSSVSKDVYRALAGFSIFRNASLTDIT